MNKFQLFNPLHYGPLAKSRQRVHAAQEGWRAFDPRSLFSSVQPLIEIMEISDQEL